MSLIRHMVRAGVLAGALGAAAACDDGTDVVESACEVVVECGGTSSVSECLDYMGELPPDCIQCVAESDCDYAPCQRLPACRFYGPLVREE